MSKVGKNIIIKTKLGNDLVLFDTYLGHSTEDLFENKNSI